MSHHSSGCALAHRRSATLTLSLLALALAVFVGSAEAASETIGDTFAASVTATGAYADSGAAQPVSISDDGRYVAFASKSANLNDEAPAGVWEAYVKDLETGEVKLVSRANGEHGEPAEASPPGEQPSSEIEGATISGDGRYVTFTSRADNLVAGLPLAEEEGEEWFSTHVYRRDLKTAKTVLVDRLEGGTASPTLSDEAEDQAISGDGRYVIFRAAIDDLDDPSGLHEWVEGAGTVYRRDLAAGTTTVVSRAGGEEGEIADRPSYGYAVSSDGRYVVFESAATNLAPGMGSNGFFQIYLRELEPPYKTALVSQSSGGAVGNGDSFEPILVGDDGCEVGFTSTASNLAVAEPTIFAGFLRNLCSTPPSTALVSLDEEGHPFEEGLVKGAGGDGRHVLIKGGQHLYLSDVETGTTALVDRAVGPTGEPSNGFGAEWGAISANGCRVAFTTQATNLTSDVLPSGGASQPSQVFVRQIAKCKPPEQGDNPGGGQQAHVPIVVPDSPTRLAIERLSGTSLRLEFTGPGTARLRIRRLVAEPRRHWPFVKEIAVEETKAGELTVELPGLPPGRYRLSIWLDGGHRRAMVRFFNTLPGPRKRDGGTT
jgi:Tol biopolymer transport system component